jgi:hypothetical protein
MRPNSTLRYAVAMENVSRETSAESTVRRPSIKRGVRGARSAWRMNCAYHNQPEEENLMASEYRGIGNAGGDAVSKTVPRAHPRCRAEIQSAAQPLRSQPVSSGDAVARVREPVEPRCFPSAEEMRMVRAIASLALLKAVRHGEYHATFHGFRVAAVRRNAPDNAMSSVEVSLTVQLAGTVVDRCELTVGAMPASLGCAESHRAESVGAETFVDNVGH